ncbi:CynX/NimT family MFS transporter [Chungangia koreensis]|uniref:CynX/NimT family MFS transporter n=1 Tax=Chungangia koreensis TaxID=752657 RepID=A0ABV8X1R7_9LACT
MTRPTHTSRKLHFDRNKWLLLMGIIAMASTLRSPLTSVGPLISFMIDHLGISTVLAGFLTTIPLIAFAIVSPFAPKISQRFGLELTLFLSICLLAVGIIIRSLGSTPALLAGTFLLGVAIAFGNVLLPSLIKTHFPHHMGFMTGIYTVFMNLAASVAIGISVPLANIEVFDWNGALGVWAVLALLAILIWIPIIRQRRTLTKVEALKPKTSHSLWRSPLAWAVTIFMGVQSWIFFTNAAWMPAVLESQGYSAATAGWLSSLIQLSQLPMTFIVPVLAGKMKDQRLLVTITSLFLLAGYIGVISEITSLTILWMILMGFGGGAGFGLALMFFTLRTETPQEAADLSGMAQSIGYLIAALGPTLFGTLFEVTASWTFSLSLFLVATLILFLTGMKAGKDVLLNGGR